MSLTTNNFAKDITPELEPVEQETESKASQLPSIGKAVPPRGKTSPQKLSPRKGKKFYPSQMLQDYYAAVKQGAYSSRQPEEAHNADYALQ